MKIEANKTDLVIKPIIFGILGGLSLLSIYFIILSLANSFSHAIEQFVDFWYWIILLVIGFGIQVGLYTFIRASLKAKQMASATAEVTTAGGLSTGAMIACCAHHSTDVLPILGLSAAALFLSQFQTLFMVIGVLSNLIGINLMLKIIQDNSINVRSGILGFLLKLDMKKSLYVTSSFSAIVFLITLAKSV